MDEPDSDDPVLGSFGDLEEQLGRPIRLDGLTGMAEPPAEPRSGALDDLADDVVEVLHAVKDMQRSTAELRSSVGQVQESQASLAADVTALRRELADDRRWQANRAAFEALIPLGDDLKRAHDGLLDSDGAIGLWIGSLLSSLRRTAKDLGFAPFAVEVGEAFDPVRMECVGYAVGESGVVLAVVRVGYVAHGSVVRPCGVAVADPGLRGTATAGGPLASAVVEGAAAGEPTPSPASREE